MAQGEGGLSMDKRSIGSLEVSVVGLGCNNFGGRLDAAATANVIVAAIDAGINFFDTADIYGGTKSEEYMGEALVGRRDQIILATKFGIRIDDARPGGASPDYIRRSAEDSLKRLKTDYIDLYQLHRPDDSVPIGDTLAAMNELVVSGKVREIGCSNFSAAQLREAEAAVKEGAARFVSVQNHYSMLHREPEAEVLPECANLGLAFLPYFPLASGALTGKYRKGQPWPEGTRIDSAEANWVKGNRLDIIEELIAFSESRGHTILELAFAWLLVQPTVASVIAGATKIEQIHANVAAAGWKLTEQDLSEVNEILAGVS
jgi:aryl-alcohol dehydrogenase-like predicted oxidoreductase